MSLRHDDWTGGALPAIGEHTQGKTATLSPRDVSLSCAQDAAESLASVITPVVLAAQELSSPSPSSVNTTVTTTLSPLRNERAVHHLPHHALRRRVHSSDMAIHYRSLVSSGGARSGAGYAAARGMESPPPSSRPWAKATSSSSGEMSPAQLLRYRHRRRTQSEANPKLIYGGGGGGTGGISSPRLLESGDEGLSDVSSNNGRALAFGDRSYSDRERVSSLMDSESELDSGSETPRSRGARSRRTLSDDSNHSSLSSSSFHSYAVSRSCGSFDQDYEPASTEKLLNLQKLYQEGFITVTEYKSRRLQLVDELTMTEKTIKKTSDLIETEMPVVHREPPDFTLLRERDAIKHTFDSEKRRWTSSRIQIKIDPHPFARGGLRQVFHLQDLSVVPQLGSDCRPLSYVAKIAIDLYENPDTYFRDVEMQAVASKFAKLYNSYNPPRRVEFLEAFILQLIPSGEDAGDIDNLTMRGTVCGVEPYIAGEYHKHNNNFGYVSELERNTPQAFSHFTYEASGKQMLVVDIQGVGDHYTDPQIHTRSGKEFGKGNLSVRGFERFLESHRCNPICRYLKLSLINPKDEVEAGTDGQTESNSNGTVPAQPYMSQPSVRVRRVDSELIHYYGDSTAFKKYQAKRMQDDQQEVDNARAFVSAMQQQRTCASFCGINACTLS